MFGVEMCIIIILQHRHICLSSDRELRRSYELLNNQYEFNLNVKLCILFCLFYDLQNCEKARQRKILSFQKIM